MNKHIDPMNNEEFLNDYNINMLWEIILDEKLIAINNKDENIKQKIQFVNNANQFYEGEKFSDKNLIHMNKDFINSIINIYNSEQNQTHKNESAYYKNEYIKADDTNDEHIKAEDIKSDRISKFEQELEKRKSAFANAVKMSIPDAPNFKDNLEEKPIGNMEELISRTMAKRNFDIEQINEKVNIEDVHNFLKGKQTSLKSEKIQYKENNSLLKMNEREKNVDKAQEKGQGQQGQGIKYIKISSENLNTKPDIIELTPIDTSSNEKKQIKWAEEIDDRTRNNSETNNIFSKLKMLKSLNPVEENILTKKSNLKKPGEESDFYKKEKYDMLANKVDLLAQKIDILIDVLLGVRMTEEV